MARTQSIKRAKAQSFKITYIPDSIQKFCAKRLVDVVALGFAMAGVFLILSLLSYSSSDPSWNTASEGEHEISNLMGLYGAWSSDFFIQTIGVVSFVVGLIFCIWGARLFKRRIISRFMFRVCAFLMGCIASSIALAQIPSFETLHHSYLGGSLGTLLLNNFYNTLQAMQLPVMSSISMSVISFLAFVISSISFLYAACFTKQEVKSFAFYCLYVLMQCTLYIAALTRNFVLWVQYYNAQDEVKSERKPIVWPKISLRRPASQVSTPVPSSKIDKPKTVKEETIASNGSDVTERIVEPKLAIPVVAGSTESKPSNSSSNQQRFALSDNGEWELPPMELLQEVPETTQNMRLDEDALRRNAELLHNVLLDFGVQGDIVSIHPGPVVTLYELEPAPGTKSNKVISLADDIARSMSAVSVRCAVVPGRNVIGIELPNKERQFVFMRELLSMRESEKAKVNLPLILGKDIGGKPIVADLAKMPHLLVAGTTGSGKSVAVNTMILSLLFRLPPEKCRFIMIDPKMLELSVYDDIPHLLSPVVTEPGKAVVALKWTVAEMEERYRAMSKLGVRNIDGYNERMREAKKKGETIMRRVQTGFNPETGEAEYEDQPMDLTELPYIVVVVDEFADLMLVAGKDVENAIQRLAQMARAAGIHLIMATQRPSVDVITGVIKANFPTRISFQVTSKIDSRTILGESGAEQLLGMGDMLYMAPGGRITRVHGPFVSDEEVEDVVKFLKQQSPPSYLTDITDEGNVEASEVMDAIFDARARGSGGEKVDELYDDAVAVVARERKASTSFIQRHLQIGYNRAARIVEEMEKQGIISKASPTGKREILVSDWSEV